nr:hypothetical protein [Tanacetum cinerariifolium]
MANTPVETYQIPIVDQPSTSKPQKKQKPRRKQRNKEEVSNDELEDEDHVPTPSSDPLPSGEDSFILNELMVFCTILQEYVEDPMKKDSLGAQEDASKHGRMIEEIDQNVDIALDDETQGRTNDDEIFRVDDLPREEVVMDTTTSEHEEQIIENVNTTELVTTAVMDTTTSEHEEQIIENVNTAELVTTAGEVVTTTTVKDNAALTTHVTEDEITMAQALAALKSIKPKVMVQEQEISTIILAVATTVTTAIATPRAKGIVFHEQKC